MQSYHYIGIDVSKDTLDYAQSGKKGVEQVANQAATIRKWLSGMDSHSSCLVLEPTGTYHDKLIQIADELGIAFALVDPLKSHYFAKSQGHTHLNDRQAARSLLAYAQTKQLSPSKMPSEQQQERKQLLSSLQALEKQKGQLYNQIHALEQLHRPNKLAVQGLFRTLKAVEQQIEMLETALNDLEDEEESELSSLIQTVKGLGIKSAQKLIGFCGDFSTFDTHKQLLKFVGVAPTSHQSGSSVFRKGKISKRGPATLRATLYMAARSARKYNLACKELYERLRAKGKPHKLALIAVVAKLLKQVFAVVKTQKPFDNQFYLKFS